MASSNICGTGALQSPIIIDDDDALPCQGNCELQFFYKSSRLHLENLSDNKRNQLIINYDIGSYVMFNKAVYELDQIDFSIPSCHKLKIGGQVKQYPMEMILYHRSSDVGNILAIGILFDRGNDSSVSGHNAYSFFGAMAPHLSKVTKPGQSTLANMDRTWNIFDAFPRKSKGFYQYQGSLINPPCREGVTWIIMDSPSLINQKILKTLSQIIPKNNRSTRKKNNREIYHNPNTEAKNTRNLGSSIKCYTDEEIREMCTCMASDKDGDGDVGAAWGVIKGQSLLIFCVVIIIIMTIALAFSSGLFSGIKHWARGGKPIYEIVGDAGKKITDSIPK